MSNELNGLATQRRNVNTGQIDSLSTLDMLTVIHQEDKALSDAIAACLPEITRLVDNATAAISRGGRVVLIGAGPSGRTAMLAASEYALDAHHSVVALMAGGPQAMLHEGSGAASDYERGIHDLEAIGFREHDMLIALTVNGKTPWVWGALRHATAAGASVAVITREGRSEAAQLADIVIAPQTGAEVVSGLNDPKAGIAQKLILNMLTTGLAIRSGRVFGNLRVDLPAHNIHTSERQIAVVMAAGECSRSVAKAALASCNNQCKTAIMMVLTGLDAWRANEMLVQNNGHLRMALQDAPAA